VPLQNFNLSIVYRVLGETRFWLTLQIEYSTVPTESLILTEINRKWHLASEKSLALIQAKKTKELQKGYRKTEQKWCTNNQF